MTLALRCVPLVQRLYGVIGLAILQLRARGAGSTGVQGFVQGLKSTSSLRGRVTSVLTRQVLALYLDVLDSFIDPQPELAVVFAVLTRAAGAPDNCDAMSLSISVTADRVSAVISHRFPCSASPAYPW